MRPCCSLWTNLKTGILDTFPKGVINLHASLLPRWRGAAPIKEL